jgi:uncharacterized membrane protein
MGRERQRGAIGVMAAITLLLALVCLALVIDTGRLYYEQRKLQRVVDMAALESATLSGMCETQGAGSLQGYVNNSATRNGFTAGSGDSLVGTLGTISFDGGYGSAQSRRVFTPGGDMADSVQVEAVHQVPSSLILNVASVFTGVPAKTALGAKAVARRTALAGLSAGSGVLALNSTNSPLLNPLLGGLLGTSLTLDAVTYQGIAGANISLLALSQQLQAAGVNLKLGDIDSLLNTNVTALQLIQAMINAADAAQLAGVNTTLLRTALTNIKVAGTQLSLGQIVKVVAPGDVGNAALDSTVNLFDLLMATALVANQSNAVDLDLSGQNIAGLKPTVKLRVIAPPTIAIGYPGRDASGNWRTVAHNAQVQLDVALDMDLLGTNLVNLKLSLSVLVADGYAALDSIQCAGAGQPVTVNVQARPSIANATLYARVGLLPAAGGNLTNITITNKATGATGNSATTSTQIAVPGEQLVSFEIEGPQDVPTAAKRVQSPLGASLGAGLTSLGNNLHIDVKLLPSCEGLLGWLTCAISKLVSSLAGLLLDINSALASVISSLGSLLIDPLLKLLGIQTGILDVRLIDLQTGGAELLI